jgi:hypothetical protein
LLWFVKGGPLPVTGTTREQVLDRVKKGDLLFGTLRFDGPKRGNGDGRRGVPTDQGAAEQTSKLQGTR